MKTEKHTCPKSFVIKRNRWIRANSNERDHSSLFRNKDKKMCCLGFWTRACGISINHIRDRGEPDDILFEYGKGLKEKLGFLINREGDNSLIAGKLMEINDDPATTDEYKEKRITSLFAQKGVKVKFI